MIIEVINKTIPNVEIIESDSDVVMTFNVEEELSARDIDLDISET